MKPSKNPETAYKQENGLKKSNWDPVFKKTKKQQLTDDAFWLAAADGAFWLAAAAAAADDDDDDDDDDDALRMALRTWPIQSFMSDALAAAK